jgi:hypothetical protein
MMTMLPEGHGVHFPTHEPSYRGWKPPKITVTYGEYNMVVTEVVSRLTEDAGTDAEHWVELIEKLDNIAPPDRDAALGTLERRVRDNDFTDDEKSKLWESLRSVTSRHREYSDAPWALPAGELEKIDRLQTLLQPCSPVDRHAWLFQDWTPPLEGYSVSRDYSAYQAAVEEARKDAVAEIDGSGGYDAFLRLAREASQAGWVGVAIADATSARYEDSLASLLGAEDPADADLGASYMARRFQQGGWSWLEGLLERTPALTAEQRAIVLLQTRDFPKAWQRADELGEEVARQFWSRFRTWGLGGFPHVPYAAERLMKVNRNAAALDVIQLYINREGTVVEALLKLAASALEALLEVEDAEMAASLRQQSLEQLFALFYEHEAAIGWGRIARLEWAYLPALGFNADPKMLGRLLATDPSMFVELASAAYRPASDNGPNPHLTRDEESRAMNAYRLLDDWSVVPGVNQDGHVDSSALEDWLSRALRGLEHVDRLRIGTRLIGRVLAKASTDPDGSWPCRAVRDLFQSRRSDQLENGFFIEVLNSRGPTMRSLEAGGRQERAIASKYRRHAEQFDDLWPRTSALLRSLADYYEREARGEDNSAERFRRGMDE